MRKSKKKMTATAQVGVAPQVAVTTASAKMTPLEFTLKAIPRLRDLKPYKNKSGELAKGIHSVYSGFNAAFKQYFGEGADPVSAQKEMVANGQIETSFAHGGVMLYLKGEKPIRTNESANNALSAILA